MTDQELPAAHLAIHQLKQGLIQPGRMLEQLVAGKLSVPTSGLPIIKEGVITGWRPATATRADGSQWLLAYTTEQLAGAYCDRNPDHGLYITVDTTWVLQMIPATWSIVFNLRTEDQFEWNAQGLARYKQNVLGWPAD